MTFWKVALGVVATAAAGYVVYRVAAAPSAGSGLLGQSPADVTTRVTRAHQLIADALGSFKGALKAGKLSQDDGARLELAMQDVREATPSVYQLEAEPSVKAALREVRDLYDEIIGPLARSYAGEEDDTKSPPLSKAQQHALLQRIEKAKKGLRSILAMGA
jgi:hypothetical protein